MILDDQDAGFVVVRSQDGQYSIWPDYKELPIGWLTVGKAGKKRECLEYIDAVWTDGLSQCTDHGRAETDQ